MKASGQADAVFLKQAIIARTGPVSANWSERAMGVAEAQRDRRVARSMLGSAPIQPNAISEPPFDATIA